MDERNKIAGKYSSNEIFSLLEEKTRTIQELQEQLSKKTENGTQVSRVSLANLPGETQEEKIETLLHYDTKYKIIIEK